MAKLLHIFIFSLLVNISGFGYVAAHPNHVFDDAAIFTILDQIHSVDVQTSQVGMDKTVVREIHDLSQRLNALHKTHQEKMRSILVQEKVINIEKTQNTQIGRYAETVSNLRSLSPQEFNHKFLEHELHFHMKVKHMIEKRLLESSSNSLFKQHIQSLAGEIEEITQKIQQIQKNYNNTKVSINYM